MYVAAGTLPLPACDRYLRFDVPSLDWLSILLEASRMQHILAIDQGTTGSTCLVVRTDGAIVGRGYREITQHFPAPGLVEHDAEEIFASTRDAAREAIAAASVQPDAIGITNQRETIVVWERDTGKPVHRAIVWQDRRTAERCRELEPRASEIMATTGLVVDPYFSATKLEWLLQQPATHERAVAGELLAGTIDSWLVWKFTNGAVHATDFTNASRTMLFDIHARQWSAPLLAMFGVPSSMLPDVRRSSGDFGIAQREHFGAPIPILGVAGDQQAALMGQGGWHAGLGKNTYGTGAFLLLNTGDRKPTPGDGLLTTLACNEHGDPCYALEASIFIAGAAVQWLRDGLGIIGVASESEAMVRSLASNDGVYFVPALTGLGAPYWEPEARGLIAGLTRGTTRAHIVRAAVEAMAYGTADVLDAMRTHGHVSFDMLRVDGGAATNNWLMQFQSDLLGVPVERPELVETTAFGAAGLAGLAHGVWPNADAFLSSCRFTHFQPASDRRDVLLAYEGWHRAVRATVAHARDRHG